MKKVFMAPTLTTRCPCPMLCVLCWGGGWAGRVVSRPILKASCCVLQIAGRRIDHGPRGTTPLLTPLRNSKRNRTAPSIGKPRSR